MGQSQLRLLVVVLQAKQRHEITEMLRGCVFSLVVAEDLPKGRSDAPTKKV